jgi:hypothetical protein
MTAVMRSMAVSSGPKVLRVGVVQDGRVVDDRIFKDRAVVTVGANEQATLVVGGVGLTSPVKLFEKTGDGYLLHVLSGMTGRVAFETGVREVATLARGPVRLTEAARGRVSLGDTTLLFQFVAPPIPASRPQLPLAIKSGLASQIDWSLTIIAAFSFLAHFGVVGAMYSDWMDPVIDTEATANGVIDLIEHIQPTAIDVPTAAEPSPATTTEPSHTTEPAAHAHVDHTPKPTKPATDEAALVAAASAIEVDVMTALQSHGTAVARALERTDIPMVDLGPSAGSAAGTRASTGNDLHFGPGALATSTGSHDLSNLAHVQGDRTGEKVGPINEPAGPKTEVKVDEPISAGTGPADAASVVARLRPGFRSCYNKGLRVDPTMSGRVMLTAKVSTNGEVASTEATDAVGLSSEVVQCLKGKLGTAQFDKVPAPVNVRIPVGFIQQGR